MAKRTRQTFKKRQREMAKKQKREDKAQRIAVRKADPAAEPEEQAKKPKAEDEAERRTTLRVFVGGTDVEFSKK